MRNGIRECARCEKGTGEIYMRVHNSKWLDMEKYCYYASKSESRKNPHSQGTSAASFDPGSREKFVLPQ